MSATAVEAALPTIPGTVPATGTGADDQSGDAFALAIELALGAAGQPPTDAVPVPIAETTDTPAETDPEEDAKGDPDATLAGFLAVLLPVPVAPASETPTATPVTAKPGDAAAVAPTGPATAPSVTQELPAPAATESSAEHPSGDQAAQPSAQPSTEPSPEPSAQSSPQSSPTSESAPATTQAPSQATVSATSPAATAMAAAAPVGTVAGPTDTTGTPAPRHVAGQVIPEVTRLFSNGEGVHRVTIELNPRALGEVKVVLTVRNGDVHVRLAAGTDARAALAHSSADLTRALEHIGIKDHRLTLAELPGVAASAATQTHSDTTESRQQQASFTGRFDAEHNHDSRQPRMGDGSTATDGTDHGSRSRGNRSIHEVSHVPSRGGVDLRM